MLGSGWFAAESWLPSPSVETWETGVAAARPRTHTCSLPMLFVKKLCVYGQC